MARRLLPPFLAALAIWYFFSDYLPPKRLVHFTFDFEGFHYPLLNYAFKALKQGRIPEWDSSIYCGLPFAGNIQAALFYPPNWLLYLANWKRQGLSFFTIEILAVFHFWLSWTLAWVWLRRAGMMQWAAVLGAVTFALCGYPLADSQHLGVLCGYAWFPLALIGVDDARRGEWRGLWKTAVASAMCLLAGYPAIWFALAVATLAYGLPGWRLVLQVLGGLLGSLALAAVQLLPTAQAARLRQPEVVYGAILDWRVLKGLVKVPELFPGVGASWDSFLYLGAGFLFATAYLIVGRRKFCLTVWRALAILGAALWFIFDPFKSVSGAAGFAMPRLMEVMQQWYFVPAIALFAALVTAAGANAFAENGARWRVFVVALVAAFTFWEFKTYGAAQPFNSSPGNMDQMNFSDARRGGKEFYGMAVENYQQLLSDPSYRVVVMGAPHPTDMRHYGLSTPQGFDPLLPLAYRREVERFVKFESNRTFVPDIRNEQMLRHFGVRYVIAHQAETQDTLRGLPQFARVGTDDSFFKIWELKDATPAYRWKTGAASWKIWQPQLREFEVESAGGGRFTLVEQRYPGWRAFLDGGEAAIQAEGDAFQAVDVPAGKHIVRFEYRSKALRNGATISAVAWLGLIVLLSWPKKDPDSERAGRGAGTSPESGQTSPPS